MAGSSAVREPRFLCNSGISPRTALRPRPWQKKIADQSGMQLDILGMKAAGKAEDGAIVLARLQDSRVRRFLAQQWAESRRGGGRDMAICCSPTNRI